MIVTTTTTTTRILSQAFISIWDLRKKNFLFVLSKEQKKLEQLFGGKYSNNIFNTDGNQSHT